MKMCLCSLAGTGACLTCGNNNIYTNPTFEPVRTLTQEEISKWINSFPLNKPIENPDNKPVKRRIIEEYNADGKLIKKTIEEL